MRWFPTQGGLRVEVGGPQPARALGAGAGLSPGWALPTPACAPPSWLQTLGAGSSGAASRPDPPALRTALPGGLGAQPTGPQGPWLCSSFSPHPLLALTRVGRVQAPAHSAWAPAPTSGSQAVPPNPIPAPQAAVAEPLVGPQDPEATRWAPAPGPRSSDHHLSLSFSVPVHGDRCPVTRYH